MVNARPIDDEDDTHTTKLVLPRCGGILNHRGLTPPNVITLTASTHWLTTYWLLTVFLGGYKGATIGNLVLLECHLAVCVYVARAGHPTKWGAFAQTLLVGDTRGLLQIPHSASNRNTRARVLRPTIAVLLVVARRRRPGRDRPTHPPRHRVVVAGRLDASRY